jgi:hypothetical protein
MLFDFDRNLFEVLSNKKNYFDRASHLDPETEFLAALIITLLYRSRPKIILINFIGGCYEKTICLCSLLLF